MALAQGAESVWQPTALGLSPSAMNAQDVITAGIGSLNLTTAGILGAVPGATTILTPLLHSSEQAMPYKTALLDHLEKPDALPKADNAVLVLNALDSLSGSDALISLRSRGHYGRTFTVVEHARQQACARLRDMSAELQGRLDMTEKRLAELATGPYSFVCIVGII